MTRSQREGEGPRSATERGSRADTGGPGLPARTAADRTPDAAADSSGPPADVALVDVVLPCLDEERALPAVLARMPRGYRAIVVDNGSTDRSAEVARALGATVVAEPRRGFGSAAHAGLLAATAPLVAFCDADGSMDPADLPGLAAPVLQGTYQLVLGRRRPVSRSSWPMHARAANTALSFLIRRATGLPLHDLGPMRVARRDELLALDLQDRRSGYPLEMVLRAHAEGLRVGELEVPYAPRIGRSKVTGTVRGTVTAIGDMSRLLRQERQHEQHGQRGRQQEQHESEPHRQRAIVPAPELETGAAASIGSPS